MPLYENNTEIRLTRGLKMFLSLKAGLVRDGGSEPDQDRKETGVQAQEQKPAPAKGQREHAPENREASGTLGAVSHEGATLPPKGIRAGGPKLKDNQSFLNSARRGADRLVEKMGLNQESSLLDLGCGPGRVPIGVLDRIGEIRKYRGADVDERAIRWAQQHITPKHPNFQFVHLNVKNARYNPHGTDVNESFTLPFADGEFDTICLYSVFSHMLTDDVRAYMKELKRVLEPGGGILMTAFIEEGVPEVTENPANYLHDWKGPLHCVLYNKEFFESMLRESGLSVDKIDSSGGKVQSWLYVSRAS